MKRILPVLLALVLAALMAGLLIPYIRYSADMEREPIRDLSNYRNEPLPGWLGDAPYLLFPEEETIQHAISSDYLY